MLGATATSIPLRTPLDLISSIRFFQGLLSTESFSNSSPVFPKNIPSARKVSLKELKAPFSLASSRDVLRLAKETASNIFSISSRFFM